jgi:hypothetical protein
MIHVWWPALFAGEDREVAGRFLAVMWENLADPSITGRGEIGQPKLFVDIPDLELSLAARLEGTLMLNVPRPGTWGGSGWWSVCVRRSSAPFVKCTGREPPSRPSGSQEKNHQAVDFADPHSS